MCRCNPSIKSPWCPVCVVLKDEEHLAASTINEAYKRVRLIVMQMNGLSEEGFTNKYMNDPLFHKGFDVLVQLMLQKGDLRKDYDTFR